MEKPASTVLGYHTPVFSTRKTGGGILRFATYGRKSVYSDKSDSVSNQERMCREYVEMKFQGQVESFDVYQDEGFTGANTDRPDLKRLLRDIQSGLFDALIVYQLDRISRDVRDFSNIYASLEEKHVMFISIKESIDTATPIGKAMMYVTMVFAQMERETIAARVTDNMLGLAKKGFWTGGPAPLGYKCGKINVGGKNHSTLVPDPETSGRVREIYQTFLDTGSSTRRLQAALTEEGMKTSKGHVICTGWLHRFLTQPCYAAADAALYDYFESLGCQIDAGSPREKWDGSCGAMVYGRLKHSGKSQIRSDPSEWTVCIGTHEPLLTSDIWIAAQKRFKENIFDKKPRREPPLLKSVVRCKCGWQMHIGWQGKHSYYTCRKRRELGVTECDMRQIPSRKLDEQVLAVLRQIAANPKAIHEHIKAGSTGRDVGSEIAEHEKRIRKLGTGLENLASSLSEGQGSTAIRYVYEQMEKMDLELSAAKRELSLLRQAERESKLTSASADQTAATIKDFVENFDGLTPERRNAVIKEVVKQCVWNGEELFLEL